MQRKTGLDLLRCLAFMFVVVFHSFLNNGYYSEPQTGGAMVLAGSARWLSVSCIGIFLMLTGYLKSDRTDFRSCYRGLPAVLLGYALAAVISIPVRHFLLGDTQSFSVWLKRLFGFTAVYYGWYVEMYVGLILLIPFVNMVLERMEDRWHLLTFAGVMLALTALPGATPLNIAPDHWRGLYPLTYYILGATVRRFKPKLHPMLGIFAALGISALLGAATVLSTDDILNEAFTQEFADLWIVLISFSLFAGLYHIRVPTIPAKLLKIGAGGCYGGYLLSHLLDAWCYRLIPQWRTPEKYWLLFLVVSLPIYFVSILSGILLDKSTHLLLSPKHTP